MDFDERATAFTNEQLKRFRARRMGWTPEFAFSLWHWIRFGRAACDSLLGESDDECGHGVAKT